jgi:hypothetical protein
VPLPSAWSDLHLYKLGIHGFINHGLHHHSLYLHQGQFGCGPDFAAGLHPSTLFLQLNNCSQENKNKYMLPWVLTDVHDYHSCFFCHENDVQIFTKDYHSSASPWMGPYSFLNIYLSDSPLSLLPAQHNTTIPKDTLSALTELNNAQAMKKTRMEGCTLVFDDTEALFLADV